MSKFQMYGHTSETIGQGSWYPVEDLSLDFNTSLKIFSQCSLTRYLISKTSAKNFRTSLQIQTQSLGWISRSSTESLNSRSSVSDAWPEIRNIRNDVAI